MSNTNSRLRSQLLIDPAVQLPVLQRTALYTTACALYFIVVLFYSESSKIDHESPWRSFLQCIDVIACWAPGITMLAPIITYDILIFTNRYAGPMFRLRREMQRLIDDESDQPIELRDSDNWMDMAELFNELREEVIELRAAKSPMSKNLFGSVSDQADSPTDTMDSEASDSADTSAEPIDESIETESGSEVESKETVADQETEDSVDPDQSQLTEEDFISVEPANTDSTPELTTSDDNDDQTTDADRNVQDEDRVGASEDGSVTNEAEELDSAEKLVATE